MGRYCDLGYHSDIIQNNLCYNKISYNSCFIIEFDSIYKKALDKLEINYRSDDILRSLNTLINNPEGICADCFLEFKNIYTTDVSNNKIIPNETYLNLLKTVVPDYIPNNITWSFHPEDSEEYDTEIVLKALHKYENKKISEEIVDNYDASRLFRIIIKKTKILEYTKLKLLGYTKLHSDLIDLILDYDSDTE